MIMMTKLIGKNDSRYFSRTSDLSYDRHNYKIVCKDKSFVVESWDEVQEYWWNNMHIQTPTIEVLDKPKSNKGFK